MRLMMNNDNLERKRYYYKNLKPLAKIQKKLIKNV